MEVAEKGIRKQHNSCMSRSRKDGYKVVSRAGVRKGRDQICKRTANLRRKQKPRTVPIDGGGVQTERFGNEIKEKQMSKCTEIREICGDYAFDVEYSQDNKFTMFFNSLRNAQTVKRCIEVDDSVPNVATAVDFVEVRHGEWHYNPDGMDWGLGAWECSLCRCKNDNLPMDEKINPRVWAGAKYCPNCGAKMDGERKEQE
jgi:hypothetical protein